MVIHFLDKDYNNLGFTTDFESIIIHDKFYDCDTMQISTNIKYDEAKFIYLVDLNRLFVIYEFRRDYDFINYVCYGLEKEFGKEIVEDIHTYSNKDIKDIIGDLIDIQYPTIPLEASNTGITKTLQVTDDNLYEYIRDLAKSNRYSIKVQYDNIAKRAYATLNPATDSRTLKRTITEGFGNIISATHSYSVSDYRNYAVVKGQGEGSERKSVIVDEVPSGQEVRKLFVDARDLSQDYYEDGVQQFLSDEEYSEVLRARGEVQLAKYPIVDSFDIEIYDDGNDTYELGEFRSIHLLGEVREKQITETITAYESGGVYNTVILGEIE